MDEKLSAWYLAYKNDKPITANIIKQKALEFTWNLANVGTLLDPREDGKVKEKVWI